MKSSTINRIMRRKGRSMSGPTLKRATFTTSRLLEFTSQKELALQTGHPAEQWPCVVAKELGDNASKFARKKA